MCIECKKRLIKEFVQMSLLKKANAAFRNKKYLESIELYEQAIKKQPQIKGIIDFNLNYAQKKIGINSSQVRKEKVSQPVPSVKKNIIESYEGKLEVNKNNLLRGWAVQTGNPSAIFELTVNVNGIEFCKIKNDKHRNDLVRHKKSTGRGGFSLHLPKELFAIDFNKLEIKYPNGQLLADLPIPEQPSLGMYHSVRSLDQAKVSVIVPVYNASDDLKVCVERLIKYTSDDTDVILIDDASPDPEIQSILKQAQQYENIRIFKNEHNLGFTGTINRGIELAGKNDVVFLNSDARVTPKWLEGLKAALATDPKIATVTPMSDRAGAFSAPNIGNENPLPEGVTEEEYAIAFRRRSVGVYPKVPTGNGFCLYVRRKCINEIGSLDAEAFPRGYGEENDFCMRALRSGWSHIIDDRTYVFHDRSKSFGEAKTELMTAGRAVVDERYPEYKLAIPVFSKGKKIAIARYCARLALQDCVNNRKSAWVPRFLFVVATQTGGTPQTNRDLMGALSDVFEGWLLRSNSEVLELSRIDGQGQPQLVRSHQLQKPVDALTHNSPEYDRVVSNWLQEFDFNLVHIRHLGWHGLSLPRLASQLAVKVVYSFHDFYALSSNLKLIDDEGVFLGNKFLGESSLYRENLWPQDKLPTPHGNWLAFWQERFQAALEFCNAFVTTSYSARRLILDAMPRLPENRFVVIPHGRDFPEFHRIRQKPNQGERIRILVPGHINAKKGLEVIRALVEYDKAEKLEFHILGRLIGEMPKKGVVTLGAYERQEFTNKARSVNPHLGIIFSVWDETYCHTLTELWSVGLPAAVLDFPNVAERVRRSGAGWVLDHQDIPKLYDEILRIVFDEQEFERTEQALADWQAGYGLANSTAQMAAGYLNIYSDVLRENGTKPKALSPFKRKRIGVVCPADAGMRNAPGSTHIRIWERTRNALGRNVTYIKMTPDILLASAREKMLDGVIIQRTAIPQERVETVITELSRSNIPYYLDLDDDLLDVPSDKDPKGVYANYAPFLRRLIDSAELVTVSTSALQERLQALHKHVILLPNHLSDRLWRKPTKPRVQDGSLRVLYMGSATHDDDLAMILPALDSVAQKKPQFRLTLIGITKNKNLTKGRPWLEIWEAPSEDYIDFSQWLLKEAARFDFAIAPLRETSFNMRKSDLKLLDYGALGLPVIASDVSVYRNANAPGIRLVDNDAHSWANALLEQADLAEENSNQGVQLKQWVFGERMLEKTLPEFDALVLGLSSKSSPLLEKTDNLHTNKVTKLANMGTGC
jgi:GT2 family glycosyltransferase